MTVRRAVAVTEVTANAVTVDPAGTDIDADLGMYVSTGYRWGEVVFRVKNTADTTKSVTVRAGDNPPADRNVYGDLTFSVAAGATKWFGPLESARFVKSDGSVNVDFDSGMTGKITALHIPRNA